MRHITGRVLTNLLLATLVLFLSTTSCDAPDPTGPASQARIELAAAPAEIPADGSSTSVITAYILNPDGSPADGVPIIWSATAGSLDTGADSVASGVAQVTLTSSLTPGTSIVTAEVTMPVRIRESIGVPFTDTRSAYVRVSSDPRSIPADGVSKALITAFATLPDGSPVYDGTTIFFTTNAGTLSSYQATTTGGEAVVQLTSDSIPQTATVTARTGDSSGSTRVDFYSVDVAWIEMRASRSEARDEDIVITAIVYGANGARVGDGVLVRFTARSYVNLSPIETSTVDGYATTVLSCGAMALDRRYIGVVATAQGVTSDELVVRMTCTGSASNPTRTPTTIPTASPTHTPTGAPSATPTRTPTATKTPEPTSTPTP